MIVPEKIDDKMPKGCGCLTFVVIIVIFAVWACNKFFICQKSHYSEAVRICATGNMPSGMEYFVFPTMNGLNWMPFVLDSNNCFENQYYEETLGADDIPSIETIRHRIIKIRSDSSNEICLIPDSVVFVEGTYLLFATKIRIERNIYSAKYLFVNGGVSAEQDRSRKFWSNILRVALWYTVFALVAMFLRIILIWKTYEENWRKLKELNISGRIIQLRGLTESQCIAIEAMQSVVEKFNELDRIFWRQCSHTAKTAILFPLWIYNKNQST